MDAGGSTHSMGEDDKPNSVVVVFMTAVNLLSLPVWRSLL